MAPFFIFSRYITIKTIGEHQDNTEPIKENTGSIKISEKQEGNSKSTKGSPDLTKATEKQKGNSESTHSDATNTTGEYQGNTKLIKENSGSTKISGKQQNNSKIIRENLVPNRDSEYENKNLKVNNIEEKLENDHSSQSMFKNRISSKVSAQNKIPQTNFANESILTLIGVWMTGISIVGLTNNERKNSRRK